MLLSESKEILKKNGYLLIKNSLSESILPKVKKKTANSDTRVEYRFLKDMCKKCNYALIVNDEEEALFILSNIKIPTDNGIVYPAVHISIDDWEQESQEFSVGYGYGEWVFSSNPKKFVQVTPEINGKKFAPAYGISFNPELCNEWRRSGGKDWGNYDSYAKRFYDSEWERILERYNARSAEVSAKQQRSKIDTSGFERDMKQFAKTNKVKFKRNEKDNGWELDDIDITQVSGSTDWRIRIPDANFSFFRAESLDEVKKLINWWYSRPLNPCGKF